MEALSLVEARTELSKHCITYRCNGAEERNRTVDLFITNELLYQLSYFGILAHKSVNKSRKMGSHFLEASLAALKRTQTQRSTLNASRNFTSSLKPGAVSTPLLMSRWSAAVDERASSRFEGESPPARTQFV